MNIPITARKQQQIDRKKRLKQEERERERKKAIKANMHLVPLIGKIGVEIKKRGGFADSDSNGIALRGDTLWIDKSLTELLSHSKFKYGLVTRQWERVSATRDSDWSDGHEAYTTDNATFYDPEDKEDVEAIVGILLDNKVTEDELQELLKSVKKA